MKVIQYEAKTGLLTCEERRSWDLLIILNCRLVFLVSLYIIHQIYWGEIVKAESLCISKIHSPVMKCCSEYCEYISKHTNQQDDIRNWVSCDIDFTFAYCTPRANITKAKVWGFCSHWKICGFLVTIFPDKSALIKKIQMQIWMQIQIRIWWWDKQACQVSSHVCEMQQ